MNSFNKLYLFPAVMIPKPRSNSFISIKTVAKLQSKIHISVKLSVERTQLLLIMVII